ncbi:MAG: transposase [Prevotellaceae bacterium]|nr:transposase [Prevotellaceae bacterium]
MTKSKKKSFRYSSCFKEKVVEEVSSGSSVSEVCRRYGINGAGTRPDVDKEIWSGRIVKHSNTNRNERRRRQIEGIGI